MDQLLSLPEDILSVIFSQLEVNPLGIRFFLTHKNAKYHLKHFPILRANQQLASNSPQTAAMLAACNPTALHLFSLTQSWWQCFTRVKILDLTQLSSHVDINDRLGASLGPGLRSLALQSAASSPCSLVTLLEHIGKACPNLVALSFHVAFYSVPKAGDRLASVGRHFPRLRYLALPRFREEGLNSTNASLKSFAALDLLLLEGGPENAPYIEFSDIPHVYFKNPALRCYETILTQALLLSTSEARVKSLFKRWGYLLHGTTIPDDIRPYVPFTCLYTPLFESFQARWWSGLDAFVDRLKLLISHGCDLLERWVHRDDTFASWADQLVGAVPYPALLSLIDTQLAYNAAQDPPKRVDLRQALVGGAKGRSLLMNIVDSPSCTEEQIDKVVEQYGLDVNQLCVAQLAAIHFASKAATVVRLLHHGAKVDVGVPLIGQLINRCRTHPDCPVSALVQRRPRLLDARALRHLLPLWKYHQVPFSNLLHDNFTDAGLTSLLRQALLDGAFRDNARNFEAQLFAREGVVRAILDDNGGNLLFKAAPHDWSWIMQLVSLGLRVTDCNRLGQSPIGHWLETAHALAIDCLTMHKQFGLDLAAISTKGDTILMSAARGGHFKLCAKILRLWAQQLDRDEIVALLHRRSDSGATLLEIGEQATKDNSKRRRRKLSAVLTEALAQYSSSPPQ